MDTRNDRERRTRWPHAPLRDTLTAMPGPTRRAFLLAATAAVAPFALPASAHATVLVHRSIEQMASSADLVVLATAQRSSALWSARRIYTDVEFTIATAVRGAAPASGTVVVRTPGGVIGRTGQRIDGAASFTTGERYILFLRRSRHGDTFETIGLAQGALRVRDATVLPAEVPPFESTSSQGLVVPREGMALDAFVRAVQRVR
jgi:hypothetical protein